MDSTDSLDLSSPPALTRSMELVQHAQGGDRTALEELFQRYQDRIVRIARIRMGSRLRSMMESGDLVQNTYAVAVQKIDGLELRSHASIIQWLSKILEHQVHDAVDYFGAQKRDRAREVPIDGLADADDDVPARDPAAPGPQPSEIASARELQEIYDACVETLTGDDREVVLLRDYGHGSWEFIRDQLGRPSVGAVQELYRRAGLKVSRELSRRLRR